jgi:hypothetical protein
MRRMAAAALVLTLAACASGAKLPAPNTAQARFEPQQHAVQVMISDLAPVAAAALLGPNGERFPAAAVTVLSGPHIAYNPPPTVGIGGFGFSGCCSGFGSGVGLGVPVGRPTPAAVSDQYISSVVIPVPAAYAQHWSGYHVQVQVGSRALLLEVPPFASGLASGFYRHHGRAALRRLSADDAALSGCFVARDIAHPSRHHIMSRNTTSLSHRLRISCSTTPNIDAHGTLLSEETPVHGFQPADHPSCGLGRLRHVQELPIATGFCQEGGLDRYRVIDTRW